MTPSFLYIDLIHHVFSPFFPITNEKSKVGVSDLKTTVTVVLSYLLMRKFEGDKHNERKNWLFNSAFQSPYTISHKNVQANRCGVIARFIGKCKPNWLGRLRLEYRLIISSGQLNNFFYWIQVLIWLMWIKSGLPTVHIHHVNSYVDNNIWSKWMLLLVSENKISFQETSWQNIWKWFAGANSNELPFAAVASILGIDFTMMEGDACNKLRVGSCPARIGESFTFSVVFEVPQLLPPVRINAIL